MSIYSSIARMAQAAKRLPPHLGAIYTGLFVDGKEVEQICREQAITQAEFEIRRSSMLRSLRTVITANSVSQ